MNSVYPLTLKACRALRSSSSKRGLLSGAGRSSSSKRGLLSGAGRSSSSKRGLLSGAGRSSSFPSTGALSLPIFIKNIKIKFHRLGIKSLSLLSKYDVVCLFFL